MPMGERALVGVAAFVALALLVAPLSTPYWWDAGAVYVGSSRVDLQACKLEYSIVSPK